MLCDFGDEISVIFPIEVRTIFDYLFFQFKQTYSSGTLCCDSL